MTTGRFVCVCVCFGLIVAGVRARGVFAAEGATTVGVRDRAQIEADWLRQNELRWAQPDTVAPEDDARGGCDGLREGAWGFHTALEDNPWWQIDLGEPTALSEIRIYNRCDATAKRASRLLVLVSDDASEWTRVYQHNGEVFYGQSDDQPLCVPLAKKQARLVKIQLPEREYLHLDEVEIYAAGDAGNIALGKPATQSSVSQWSSKHETAPEPSAKYQTAKVLEQGFQLAESLEGLGVGAEPAVAALQRVAARVEQLDDDGPAAARRQAYFEARTAVRQLALANPLLDFDSILFVKRAPGTLPHMSDQYYGWWSRPGGGICVLEDFQSDRPRVRCLTADWPEGSFLRPDLSYDGKRVLFAYCWHYPQVSAMEKVDKRRLPEDAFYHLFEMNLDGTGCRQLTRGRYDDFDARYLPNGQIVFLSTRKGWFVQCTKANSDATTRTALPDSYVRCGGDNTRPCAVFTLHKMNADGGDLQPISAFENFEWTPSVSDDGRILYARWDYIDRFNGPFMSLWSTNPDGGNAMLVYGNYTKAPQCVFEARSIPNSRKLVFTGSAHHSITGGSLALLDRSRGDEGEEPLTRLTPEVAFPETERWEDHYYANPYPLSEDFYLVAWSDRRLPPHKGSQQVDDERNPPNALGLYLYDAFGNLELLYRDPEISSMYPIPVRPRPKPPIGASVVDWEGPQHGSFLLADVYRGLERLPRGSVKQLRIVGVPPKTQPHKNQPVLGVSLEDPGKFVLGTVPVHEDGSAYFHVPSGIPIFFQALDADGMAVQTMRSLTYVQPSQTLSCIGCHESRDLAPPAKRPLLAARRGPSMITPGPPGSWPLRFDQLVQPVLDRHCVSCHRSDHYDPAAAAIDLQPASAYETLLSFGDADLQQLAFEKDMSLVGECVARKSRLLSLLTEEPGHHEVALDPDSFRRLVTWMDVYAHFQGSFSQAQEAELRRLRRQWSDLFAERAAAAE